MGGSARESVGVQNRSVEFAKLCCYPSLHVSPSDEDSLVNFDGEE